MIITALVSLVTAIVQAVLSLIPQWSVDPASTVGEYSNTFATVAGSLDGYVPERLGLICLGVLVALRLFMFAWKGVLFVYGLIPFKAT